MFTYDVLFHLFCAIDTISHVPKSTRVNKIHILTRKYYIAVVNLSPIWKNTLGHILLESLVESTVLFTVITNIITSNPNPHMVVPFQ